MTLEFLEPRPWCTPVSIASCNCACIDFLYGGILFANLIVSTAPLTFFALVSLFAPRIFGKIGERIFLFSRKCYRLSAEQAETQYRFMYFSNSIVLVVGYAVTFETKEILGQPPHPLIITHLPSLNRSLLTSLFLLVAFSIPPVCTGDTFQLIINLPINFICHQIC